MQSAVFRLIVGAALLLFVAVSCGDASPEESSQAGDEVVQDRLVVPSFFFSADANVVGATRSHLVGFTKAQRVGGSIPKAVGDMVDLTSGEVERIEPPHFDGDPFNPLALATNDQLVLLVGQTCPSLWEGEEVCRDGRPASFAFEPETGQWTPHPIQVDGDAVPEDWSVVYLGVQPRGSFVAVFREGRGSLRHHVMTFTSDEGWSTVIRDLSVEGSLVDLCATADHVFLLRQPSTQGADDQGLRPVALELDRLDLDTGVQVDVVLPPLATGVGAAGVQFGCGPDVPVVSSSQPELLPDGEAKEQRTYQLVDDGWVELMDLFDVPDLMVTRAIDGPAGVVLSGRPPMVAGREQPRGAVAIGPDGVSRMLPQDMSLGGRVVWRSLTGALLMLDEVNGTELVSAEVFS